MSWFLLGVSFIINVFYISITFIIFKNKKTREFFRKEVEDVQAFKEFFNSNRIDF